MTKGGRGGHAEGTGSDAHTHEPLLEHISNSGMEKQTEALCPEPIMCIQLIQGLRMFIETSQGVSPPRDLQVPDILLSETQNYGQSTAHASIHQIRISSFP